MTERWRRSDRGTQRKFKSIYGECGICGKKKKLYCVTINPSSMHRKGYHWLCDICRVDFLIEQFYKYEIRYYIYKQKEKEIERKRISNISWMFPKSSEDTIP